MNTSGSGAKRAAHSSADNVTIRLIVEAGFALTLRAPITREAIAAAIDCMIADTGGIQEFIDKVEISGVQIDDEEQVTL